VRRTLLIIAAMSLLVAGPALGANSINVALALHTGGLTLQAPALAATPGRSVQVPLTIADARGNGDGWTLKLAGSASMTITSITARCATGSTCTLPSGNGRGGILQAARDSGMGVIELVVTVAPLRSDTASVPLVFNVR
jgi:hypothetical protein